MAIIAKEPEGNFEQIETGTYQAVCAEVIDLGMRETQSFSESNPATVLKHKITIVWELNEQKTDGKRFVFSKEYVLSLHEKATLRKDLDAWRGVPFTADELKGFDVEKVIGANCMLTVSAYERKNGGEGRKITAVSKTMKGLAKIELSTDYLRPKFINDIINGTSDAPHPAEQYVDESGLPF